MVKMTILKKVHALFHKVHALFSKLHILIFFEKCMHFMEKCMHFSKKSKYVILKKVHALYGKVHALFSKLSFSPRGTNMISELKEGTQYGCPIVNKCLFTHLNTFQSHFVTKLCSRVWKFLEKVNMSFDDKLNFTKIFLPPFTNFLLHFW